MPGPGWEETDLRPLWSPEGTAGGPWLYFLSDRAGGTDLYWMQPDGSGVEPLTSMSAQRLHVEWTPDRRWLVYWPNDPYNPVDGFRMRPDGSEAQQTIWRYIPSEDGRAGVLEETPLADDRWLLVQNFQDCENWTVEVRAAESSEVRAIINVGAYALPDLMCYVGSNVMTVGSRHLDGYPSGEWVIWLPLNEGGD